MARRPRSWIAIYAILAVLWGSSFAFIKTALASFTPLGLSLGRMLLAAATLLAICAVTRTPLPPRRLWGWLAIAALMATVMSWTLVAWAQTYISSVLAAIVTSSVPLWTLLVILVFFREERPTRSRVVGLLLGFVGILVVVGVWRGLGAATLLGVLGAFAGCFAFAASIPFTRHFLTGSDSDGSSGTGLTRLSPLSLAAGLFVFAVIETAPFALFTDVVHADITVSAVLALIAVGCLSSGIAYVLNYRLIQLTDSTTASTVMYAAPLVAIGVGTLFLGEAVTWNEPVGCVLILLGAALAQNLIWPLRRTPAASIESAAD